MGEARGREIIVPQYWEKLYHTLEKTEEIKEKGDKPKIKVEHSEEKKKKLEKAKND